ncbi:cell division protein FtsZ [Falsirhodobacter algicola]|uniref:Cell division protein FtsZ n=1 Tax=Falsirhodobacter algicola TaxID=2692330 RepID=A0A8J8MRL4_9RHOB|nr:cell division protein FtsZ [Falsirhodobacter algicola]QUS35018.1 cell division protein FtsZ [Falsirhodobacter algicola]
MPLNLMNDPREELKPRITVFGVGGAGGNAVNNMIEQQLEGVEFVVANTDAQALQQSNAGSKIQMGLKVTEGLGAGARPSVGAAAAEETIEEIVDHLAGAHMCFITAGMGGGTGTGAAPIIAQAARELGVLTVGVVTKPFQFEGNKRMRQAEEGIENLQKVVDTLIIIPNQNLFRLANERTTFTEAFAMADDVLYQGVKGVTDLMVRPGLINLDFADVRAVMDEMGKAMMGTGEAEGDERAKMAAEKAIANPLLDEISLNGAKGVLINITGGYDLTLFELDEAAQAIRDKVDPDANIIVGSTLDTTMEGRIRVSVVATGIEASKSQVSAPTRPSSQPLSTPMQKAEERMVASKPAAPAPAPRAEPVATRPMFEPPREELEEEPADLPPPAYRPAPAEAAQPPQPAPQPRPQPRASAPMNEDAGAFVAPRPRSAGQPSPETMARLAAAVSKAPARGSAAQTSSAPRPAQPAPRQPQQGERPRFGIGSLINRMAGHADQPEPRPQPTRTSQQVAYEEQEEQNPDQERIDIPAFLRRQAN